MDERRGFLKQQQVAVVANHRAELVATHSGSNLRWLRTYGYGIISCYVDFILHARTARLPYRTSRAVSRPSYGRCLPRVFCLDKATGPTTRALRRHLDCELIRMPLGETLLCGGMTNEVHLQLLFPQRITYHLYVDMYSHHRAPSPPRRVVAS